jgi:hypothetical protein
MEVSCQLHAPAALPPGGRAPGTRRIGGGVGPWVGLDAVVKRKIPSLCRDSNPPIIQTVAQRYTAELSRLLNMSGKTIEIAQTFWTNKKPN